MMHYRGNYLGMHILEVKFLEFDEKVLTKISKSLIIRPCTE